MGKIKVISGCGLALAATACGGGGEVASTPPPPPPATFTYTKLADMSGNRTFQTAGVTYDPSTTGFTNASAQAFGSGVQVAYNAAADSYTLTAPSGTTATFGPAQLTQPQQAPNVLQYVVRNDSNTVTDVLNLIVPQTASGVPLSYTLIGTWGTKLETGTPTYRVAVGGAPTLAGDMPKTGSASYAATVGGAARENGQGYLLSPNSTATFTANFGNGTVATTINLVGVQGSNAPLTFGSASATGTIASDGPGFTGTFSGTAYNSQSLSGQLSGAFFGPQALEMGYAYTLSAGDFSAVGSVTGVKQ